MNRTFKNKELLDLDLPRLPDKERDENGVRVFVNVPVDQSRWTVGYELVFQLADDKDDEAWRCYYEVGATEHQDQGPWEYEEEVEAVRVYLREVKRMEWVADPLNVQ